MNISSHARMRDLAFEKSIEVNDPAGSVDPAAERRTEPTFCIWQNDAGWWILRDSRNLIGGRFRTLQASLRFIRLEYGCKARTKVLVATPKRSFSSDEANFFNPEKSARRDPPVQGGTRPDQLRVNYDHGVQQCSATSL